MRNYKSFNKQVLKKEYEHLKELDNSEDRTIAVDMIENGKLREVKLEIPENLDYMYGAIRDLQENTNLAEKEDEEYNSEYKTNLLDYHNENKSFLDSIDYFIPHYIDFYNELDDCLSNYHLIEDYNEENEKRNNDTAYTNKKILKIVREIYNTLDDKQIKEIFNREYKKKAQTVAFLPVLNSYNITNVLFLNKYITISRQADNINKIATAAHEYGHSVQSEIIYSDGEEFKDYPFVELFSQFMQIYSSEYLYEKTNNKKILLNEIDMLLTIYDDAYTIITINENKDAPVKSEEDVKLLYNNILDEDILEHLETCNIETMNDYIYSYAIALELLNEYKTDPKKAMYDLKKIITMYDTDYDKEIRKLGIVPGKSLNNYTKQLSKKLNKAIN